MKEIRKAIHSLTDENRHSLIARLHLKSRSEGAIVSILTSYTGIHDVLSTLDSTELAVIEAVYGAKDGMTLGELEKMLKLKISDIAALADSLSHLCLLYIMKNRQLINNKLDKIYGIAEISDLLSIETAQSVKDHLGGLSANIVKPSPGEKKPPMDEEDRRIMTALALNGFIAPISRLREQSSGKVFDTTLEKLIKKGWIRMFHVFTKPFSTIVAIDGLMVAAGLVLLKEGNPGSRGAVCNRLFFLNNLLFTYDTVTTYGLFLTKQLEFRKIDIKRISDSLINLKEVSGHNINRETLSSFILYVLSKLGCLKLLKDTAHLSLADVQKDLDHPPRLIARVLRVLKEPKPANPFFPSPLAIPPAEAIATVVSLLEDTGEIPFIQCALASFMITSGASDRTNADTLATSFKQHMDLVMNAAELLCIMGVVDINNGSLSLSDIGEEVFQLRSRTPREPDIVAQKKAIYINPDFTMVIPLEEIESRFLYHLLAYVQILKHDVIMHVQISKESIVKAKKRGMQLKRFLEILTALSKNEIPQNMKFLLNEWARQTVELAVSNVILLKTSHPNFIDELLVGKMKHCVIDRISDTCAIIQKDCIDDIVKTGRKKDAVITLFADDEIEA